MGGTLFRRWNEKLVLQRSVKASKGSTVGQTTGGFFSLCSLSNYTAEEGNIRRVGWGGMGGWYSTAEVRKMDILRERETKREWLQKVPYLWCSVCTFCCIICRLLPNLEIIRQRVLNGAWRLKRLIGSGHSNTEFTWVEWDWEAGRRQRGRKRHQVEGQ